MSTDEQRRSAERLLRDWPSDEDVERLTGVSLLDILSLRAAAASAPRPRIAMGVLPDFAASQSAERGAGDAFAGPRCGAELD